MHTCAQRLGLRLRPKVLEQLLEARLQVHVVQHHFPCTLRPVMRAIACTFPDTNPVMHNAGDP